MEKEKNPELEDETLKSVTGGIWLGNQIRPVTKIGGQRDADAGENAASNTDPAYPHDEP